MTFGKKKFLNLIISMLNMSFLLKVWLYQQYLQLKSMLIKSQWQHSIRFYFSVVRIHLSKNENFH